MSNDTSQAVVIVANDDPEVLARLAGDLTTISEGAFTVAAVANRADLVARAEEAAHQGKKIPLVIVDQDLGGASGVDILIAGNEHGPLRAARKVLMADRHEEAGLDRIVRSRALDATLTKPWGESQLRAMVYRLVTEFFIEEAPEQVDEMTEVVDVDVLSHAFVEAEEQRREADRTLRRLQRSFLDDRALSDDEVEQLMITEIDRALDTPQRHTVPAGTMILHEGERVDGIHIVVAGRVRLTLDVDDRVIGFHSRTAGRIIGLNAVAGNDSVAFFNVVAIDETTFITLSLEQLDTALQTSPTLAIHFVTVLLRSMARRNLRSVETRLQVDSLAHDLVQERDELADAIDRLGRARSRLVESEKLATLGQLAAGVGHELNNPAAAISRATDFLGEDVAALAADVVDGVQLGEALRIARETEPLSTRVERQRRDTLAAAIGDDTTAKRLVRIGIDTVEAYRAAFDGVDDPEARLDRLELYHRIGASLRSIDTAAARIVRLVGSLRSYARSGHERVDAFDVREGIEETLLLLGHDLRHVTVERDYGDDVPPIAGSPGDLDQVWTNLITNAIQAMQDRPVLRIAVSAPQPDEVEVTITDNGTGIARSDLSKIFEATFTTKSGRVEFGLGLGLQIVKDIIVRHGGTIRAESVPGNTTFTVRLPAAKSAGPAPTPHEHNGGHP
ncbi:MAG: ATP-binding protein [Acidimicrobiia bacterium]|jgi:signal transduction histidine kinase